MRPLPIPARWLLAAVFGLAVAWQSKFGPVLFKVSPSHGFHAGDISGFAVGALWAVLGDPRRSRKPEI